MILVERISRLCHLLLREFHANVLETLEDLLIGQEAFSVDVGVNEKGAIFGGLGPILQPSPELLVKFKELLGYLDFKWVLRFLGDDLRLR